MSNIYHIYQVALSDIEKLGMEYCAASVQDWIDNVVHNRARIAIDDIVQKEIQSCISSGVQIPTSKEAIVLQAFQRGTVKKGIEYNNVTEEQ